MTLGTERKAPRQTLAFLLHIAEGQTSVQFAKGSSPQKQPVHSSSAELHYNAKMRGFNTFTNDGIKNNQFIFWQQTFIPNRVKGGCWCELHRQEYALGRSPIQS